MNQQLRSATIPMTTQAAEGLSRRRWTVAEIEKATQLGVLPEQERFELIGGEIVPMSPRGLRHEVLKAALNEYWVRKMPKGFRLVTETTFRVTEDTFFEPDFMFYRLSNGLANLSPRTALLAVEVSDSSLAYDLNRKARLMASHGVQHYWVIEAWPLVCHCHSNLGPEGYRSIARFGPDDELVPPFAPELSVVLATLEMA